MIAALMARLGRRGAVLALFGLAWMIQGLAAVLLGGGMDSGEEYALIHESLPPLARALLWGGTGAAAIGLSLRPRRKDDTAGYLAVTAMPMFLGTSYAVGGITAVASPEVPNEIAILGVLGFSIYGVVSAALALIASWPEPPETNGGEHE